jgi:hypothetical protein
MADKTRAFTKGYVFLDNSGNPLASGTINAYQEGTTTNKDTYTDQTGSTTNANPVVLDSNGRADIWLDVDTGYKFLIKDSSGTEIDTIDNFFGVQADDIQFADAKGIYDDSGNEQLIFQKTTSAVNYFEMTNSAASGNLTLAAVGDDTNISIDINPKGSGSVSVGTVTINTPLTVQASASSASEIRLEEDTDNGSNYVALKAADTLAGNVTWTLPSADSAGIFESNGSGTVSIGTLTATPATQAEMETATSTTVAVTPGRVQYHPGVSKAWCHWDNAGTIAIQTSHNITSITDTATGRTQVTIDTDFSTASYAVTGMTGDDDTTGNGLFMYLDGVKQAGRIDVAVETDAGSLTDADFVSVTCFGDQ